jgi:hypothetical protein
LRCASASDRRGLGACSAIAACARPLSSRTGTATAIGPAMKSSRSFEWPWLAMAAHSALSALVLVIVWRVMRVSGSWSISASRSAVGISARNSLPLAV